MKRIVMALALFALTAGLALAADPNGAPKAPQGRVAGVRYELARLGNSLLEKARSLFSPTPVPMVGLPPMNLNDDCGKGTCNPAEPGCRVGLLCPDPLAARPGHTPRGPDTQFP